MGHNTSVIILNDAFHAIEDDPEFGKNLVDAIRCHIGHCSVRHTDVEARSKKGGIHCNAASVIESHHADQTSVVAFGGNCGQVLGEVYGWWYNLKTPEDRVKLLKELAENEGYTLRKKAVRRTNVNPSNATTNNDFRDCGDK